jgi:hypothetical protein
VSCATSPRSPNENQDSRKKSNSRLTSLTSRIPFFATLTADTRERRVPLTKRYFSGLFLKLTHCQLLTSGTKREQCSSYVPILEPSYVEDIRGRGGGAGVNFAVRRDDRGLGPADPPVLRSPGGRALRKKGKACDNCGLPVDTAGPRDHHRGGESASMTAFASSPVITAKSP